MLTAAADVLLPDPGQVPVGWLGIDEHRYRSVPFFRNDTAGGGATSRG